MVVTDYKNKVLMELMRYHEAITDYYSYTEPHTKVESDLYLNLEDLYKDVVNVIRWGDEEKEN